MVLFDNLTIISTNLDIYPKFELFEQFHEFDHFAQIWPFFTFITPNLAFFDQFSRIWPFCDNFLPNLIGGRSFSASFKQMEIWKFEKSLNYFLSWLKTWEMILIVSLGRFSFWLLFLNNQLGDLNEINKSWAYTSLNFVHKNFLFLFHSSMTK